MKNITLKDYRLLTKDEHQNLLAIRNQEAIRKASLTQDMIALDKHLLWVDGLMGDTTKKYFAIIHNDKIIGGINIFDIETKIKWGIFFDDEVSLILKSVIPIYFIDFIFNEFECDAIYAEIKQENVNAVSYNKNLGFEMLEDGDIVTMHLKEDAYKKAKKSFLLKKIVKKIELYDFKIKRYNEN